MKSFSKIKRRPQVEQLEDRCIPGSMLDLLANPFLASLGAGLSLGALESSEAALSILLPGDQTPGKPSQAASPPGRFAPGDSAFGVNLIGSQLSSSTPGGSGADLLLAAANQSSQATAGNVVSAVAQDAQGVRVIWGESSIIDGARLTTWALVSPHDNSVLAVGGSMSIRLFENQPQEPGPYPAGAVASLDFPELVQATTYFNHLEIHSNPHGHPTSPFAADPNHFRVPHFDFHFYTVSEEAVWAVPGQAPPLPPVSADHLPAGYAQAGPSEAQMGRHSQSFSELAKTGPFSAAMIAGFTTDGTQMSFIEPMVNRDTLLARQDFTLDVPMPQTFGRDTLYPTQFQASYQGSAYHFVFSDFVNVH